MTSDQNGKALIEEKEYELREFPRRKNVHYDESYDSMPNQVCLVKMSTIKKLGYLILLLVRLRRLNYMMWIQQRKMRKI